MKGTKMLWEVEIHPAEGQTDRESARVRAEAVALGVTSVMDVWTAKSFLVEGHVDEAQVASVVAALLTDEVVEQARVHALPDTGESRPRSGQRGRLLNVLFKPGVTDNVGGTAAKALADLGLKVERVATCRKYWVNGDASDADVARLSAKVLANDSIERVIEGPLPLETIALGSEYRFDLKHVPLREMDDDALARLSKEGQLYLSLVEMQTIQRYFHDLGREPADIELETIAQTWSEHCSHKTLAGRIVYRDEQGERRFENMLKETVFAATQTIRKRLGEDDWCVSVFKDNAGIVRFDEKNDVCIKVETHNHPSALEPYGGANTGLGGVIRDPLGTGLGARPVCNTDVFCFAPPDTRYDALPPGVLHPKTVMRGVVAGVRDYGNRMGIPTVNGAVYFDERYLGNPLVYCGNVAMIPRGMSEKRVVPGDFIVAVGGRTGRDGIHGATFSSAELTHESDELSGGAVQIGNAITEKMLLDVILEARDRGLYHAITDCGAGGFSSAVGEMGEQTGAEVWLEKAPLKYSGLSYTEIWISEAQERMVLAVPPQSWEEFESLCASEGVEATVIGKYTDTKRLVLQYDGTEVGNLDMAFLHNGRPPVVREAVWRRGLRAESPESRDGGVEPQNSDDRVLSVSERGIDIRSLMPQGSVSGEDCSDQVFEEIDVDLASFEPAERVVELIPQKLAKENCVIAIAEDQGTLTVAVSEAFDFETIERLRFILNREIKAVVASKELIEAAIERLYPAVERDEDEPLRRMEFVSRSAPDEPQAEVFGRRLKRILGSLNVCSKEWIIRQYDHEVQAGSVVKPLVGVKSDGPSDAAIVRPILTSDRGLVIACGMNPRYGDIDPYWMAASAIDEAVRNCVAVGADPSRIAILDNFCWGNTARPETLGSLVRAALGCHDVAVAYGTPFVSGKDSLNNEFSFQESGDRSQGSATKTISIPPSLLITALGQIADIHSAVTMDLKEPRNVLLLVGQTLAEFGGSHYKLITGDGREGAVPRVNLERAPKVFGAVHHAIEWGLVRSCHDLSEGGLAVALAEMAFAGGLGIDVTLDGFGEMDETVVLFSESNTRFVLEVPAEAAAFVESLIEDQTGLGVVRLGRVTDSSRMQVKGIEGRTLIDDGLAELKACWQSPLRWE